MARPITADLTNQRFGRLLVLEETVSKKRSETERIRQWKCLCECGNTKVATHGNLMSGYTRSCGCLQNEVRIKTKTTHGLGKPVEWDTWRRMRGRCNNAKHPDYHNYGGQGIQVCKRWASFKNFYADMGERPSPKHSLGRIDNDRDYEPSNCRWETWSQQVRNRRNSLWVIYKGKRISLKDLAELLQLNYTQVYCWYSICRKLKDEDIEPLF